MTDETLRTSTAVAPQTTTRASAVRFSARDLVNVAIFAVIYFVIVFVVAMLGLISPLVMLLTLPLSAVAAGIPYMLFLTRVRSAGMVTLFGVVVALLYLMMGHPWQSTVVTIVLSVFAELVLRAGRYRSKWATIWTYVVFSGWFAGPWIPFFLDPVAYLRSSASQAMGEAYVKDFAQVVTTPAVTVMVAVTLVCGFLGALLGTALLRKHFQKAGLA
ncbi:MptD family putative ECF transporter S component [Salinispora arenicola]|uniref:Energy-coupling factor transport system substrate-specific component n=1 Tax=Salinispora arenicola TaxID=168697 RepID=A0A542XLI9_SALAC|nr:MptD family putative ECF transporter S component [Salinispora arenicola]MCN0152747.1 MptD family putative ECF transporter S component [Salinispora arenicola]TQL36714.1 energy-coupling factor transport system substrate-specific component [Salinispora arenicola]GIM88101.1 membrane protein [Salinispora arenicola]